MDYEYVKTLHIIAAMVVFASVVAQYVAAVAGVNLPLIWRKLRHSVTFGVIIQIITGIRLVSIAQFPYTELWLAGSLLLLVLFIGAYHWVASRKLRVSGYYLWLMALYLLAVILMVLRPEWA